MPNGLLDWEPLADSDVSLSRIWGALGIISERTKLIPKLVTKEECRAVRAERESESLAALLNGDKGKAAQRGARGFTVKVALLSAFFAAAFSLVVTLLVGRIA